MRLSFILCVISATILLAEDSTGTTAGYSTKKKEKSTNMAHTPENALNEGNRVRYLRARETLEDDGEERCSKSEALKAFESQTYAKRLYARWLGHRL
ncbi:unnamed protein product [Phytophthora lilii]|uniref:RxLR effector protein n=1 Tax=Phytophthora lilii TaxID=2077276 RepID=A0A9W6YDR9_9STRA|nr:unnamed protein product [Phytophthora lilii]